VNWYCLRAASVVAVKVQPTSYKELRLTQFQGGSAILKHYGNSLPDALANIYPNIGLDKILFSESNYKEK
jgi:hypothetical protein